MEKPKKVAILNAHGRVHAALWDVAAGLKDSGFSVDIFLFKSDEGLVSDLLVESKDLRIFRLLPVGSSQSREAQPDRLANAPIPLWKQFYRLLPAFVRAGLRDILNLVLFWTLPEVGLIPRSARRSVIAQARVSPYLALIGVEKGGLAFAGRVALRLQSPLAYHSLELYTWDHPFIRKSPWMKRFKTVEEKYHRQAALTIVQDEERGRVLLRDNNVKASSAIAYLPVSVPSGFRRSSSSWLRDKLNLQSESKVLLAYGEFSERRLSFQLAHVAQTFPEAWLVVFHGYGTSEARQLIEKIDSRGRVRFSTQLVRASEQAEIIASADIGLALYASSPLNDQLTGFSSEKIAMYMCCGLPIIGFRYKTYEHIETEQAGVLLNRMEDLRNATASILADYERFAQNALRCYERYYQFERNFAAIPRVIQSLGVSHAYAAGNVND